MTVSEADTVARTRAGPSADRRSGRARAAGLVGIVSALFAVLLATVALGTRIWSAGPVLFDSYVDEIVSPIAFFAWSAVGILVLARRPANRIGLILLIAGLAGQIWVLTAYYATLGLIVRPGSLPTVGLAAWMFTWLPTVAFGLAFTFLFLLFPDGDLPSPRWRPFAWFAGAAVAFIVFTWATAPGPLGGTFDIIDNPAGIEIVGRIDSGAGWMLLVLAVLGSVVAPVVRLRRSSGVQRQQLKWFTFTGAVVALTWLTVTVGSAAGPPFTSIAALTYPVAICAVPVAVSVAILKYNLYDIDVVISRTIVVGALAVLVTAGYVAVVTVLGAAIGRAGETGLGLSVLATAMVAVAFQPVRTRVGRLANRLVYGPRATPYEVLSVLARRMAEVYAADDLLAHLAKTLVEGTGASRVEVWLLADRRMHRLVCWPAHPDRPVALPVDGGLPTVPGASEVAAVRHQGTLVGALAITLPPGLALSGVERRLLADLAAQVGVALDNLRLIEEVKASRLRIVAAQDQERQRIERDIHDGVQQRLVSLSLALRMAAARQESAADAAALDAAVNEALATLAELRRLARGIHPAIVNEGGLVAALESLAERSAVPTEITAVPVQRLPASVEVTIYYLVAEALTNAAKHARATTAAVNVEQVDGRVRVVVTDNGIGGATPGAGSGLTGLADRVAALDGTLDVDSPPGGGTRLMAEIPCASS